jgi:uncharacterized protein YjiS (DUF1127 family)
MLKTIRNRYSVWKRYNRTVSELQNLTLRELDDLGIAPGDITAVARAAARGTR